MCLAVLIHQAADGAAGRVVDTGYAARADCHKFLLLRGRLFREDERPGANRKHRQHAFEALHRRSPLVRRRTGNHLPTVRIAESMESPSRSTMISIVLASVMNGGARST